ncbi:hypothetical protein C5167_009856 [Papaver somniferum]|uniref:Small ribosomal subunit protein uS14m n=1 Tax=Papaver somniferum TaxID=3469 RepID=A0A4Y7K1G6_PAPSO|nr:uncharacterized protein LOC113285894 [Papaver somniferum]RZC66160.1 hypothetical protein C5167_009856 [Papaver somniferum]
MSTKDGGENRFPLETRNIRDHKCRLLAEKFEMKRIFHKAMSKDNSLPAEMRDEHRLKLSKLPRNSSFTRIVNRCVFTGRARAVYKMFRMSRIVFRDLADKGALTGVKKSSW